MVAIEVGTPKMPQEYFRVLQGAVARGEIPTSSLSAGGIHSPMYKMLTDILDQLEIHRPHGIDGKHGDLHTPTCGCLDVTVILPNRDNYNFSSFVGPKAFDIAVARMNHLPWNGEKFHEMEDRDIRAQVEQMIRASNVE